MAKVCENCGNKLGFLNKTINCGECGKSVCGKCLEWNLFDQGGALGIYSNLKEVRLCSSYCATEAMTKVIDKLDPNSPIKLINADNSGIQIDEESKRKGSVSVVMYNMKGTPQDAMGIAMIPAAQGVYDDVKNILQSRGLNFTESKETYV